jgi:polyhydroxybutyrate depolymerase
MLNFPKQLLFVLLFAGSLLFTNSLFAQLDSIFDQGVYRTFIVHLPTGNSAANEYPLVLNLHGLTSSAALQQAYTQFDDVANSLGLVVVHPDGINNSWTTIGNSDSYFLSNLVETIRANYSNNKCLFVTGMSQGGFMTYKFSNTTSHNVTAIAVGSGNMSNALQNSSTYALQIPVMYFHGTDDNLVSYDGTFLISSIEKTIQWWVEQNNCNTTPVVTAMPDIDLTDNSTVEKYHYGNGTNDS